MSSSKSKLNSPNDKNQNLVENLVKTERDFKRSFIFSVIGGLFASLASVFGKIVVDATFLSNFFSQDTTQWLLRAISISGIFISTTLQWRYAAKGMDLAYSTLTSTVITTASNFFFTAFFGWLFFKETFTYTWWVGASFITAGLLLMNSDNVELPPKSKSTHSKKNK
ncbi:hypothetical protein DLAC_01421 [Tieghemostelium lacteum]|uniref:Transmembrane protein n=1 Tax=Tieghemostelium lacteum TaxID=361077 RepID=A0A152A5S0_TIELA|nr:hypothetical protein DLAC_01421 [Tieghemostelium lacteum]|eukprot:KYR01441.1 hypothetical protein DLAC_01421 [Tieghemostelium lacteum]